VCKSKDFPEKTQLFFTRPEKIHQQQEAPDQQQWPPCFRPVYPLFHWVRDFG
jgi:hypothetical protein